MYTWYAQAEQCYAYLDDVSSIDDLAQSEWLTRGWTLQELLAPTEVVFFTNSWGLIGTRKELCHEISKASKIDDKALYQAYDPMSTTFSIAQRMSWASLRSTTRAEDMDYSLMGLFNINMPLLYGEGGPKSFVRLQQEIIRISNDQSIFAWSSQEEGHRSLLAMSPRLFQSCHDIIIPRDSDDYTDYSITNQGLSIQLQMVGPPIALDTYSAFLNCKRVGKSEERIVIFLEHTHLRKDRICARVMARLRSYAPKLRVLVPQYGAVPYLTPMKLHGFRVCFEHVDKRQTFKSISTNCREWPLIGSLTAPQRSHGTAGVLAIPKTSSRLAAIQLGFDKGYNPVCRLLERNHEYPNGFDRAALDDDWINEDINSHRGACDTKSYRVLRQRRSWYFAVPKTSGFHLEKPYVSLWSVLEPERDDIDLGVTIWEVNLQLFIRRYLSHNRLIWYVRLVEYDYDSPARHVLGSEPVIRYDQKTPYWQPSPEERHKNDPRKDWRALKVSESQNPS